MPLVGLCGLPTGIAKQRDKRFSTLSATAGRTHYVIQHGKNGGPDLRVLRLIPNGTQLQLQGGIRSDIHRDDGDGWV
ncbi:hypothetical protein Stube_55540 [Streptomyces tubercidicus]|uniref:Uncharacterized protein n=1 Tax=Streptomyces tubercidicus TaxID=47759 RepID=A0A640V1Q9_9ACTN|nr:hypothetical protein Stube_55540 [Streptomyces tubercidicus]